jgi:hypothetical protein
MRLAWKNILHDRGRFATSEHVREIAMGIRGRNSGSRIVTAFAEIERAPGGMTRSPWPPPFPRSAGVAGPRPHESAKIGVSDD